jgi:hypothetical protein
MSQPYLDDHGGSAFRAAANRHARDDRRHDDHRLERLIRRLPERRQLPVRWLRSRAARWVRLPLGVLFILGSFLFILPVFGLWMLPVGLLLLAEDVPALHRPRGWILDRVEYYRPHWFSE